LLLLLYLLLFNYYEILYVIICVRILPLVLFVSMCPVYCPSVFVFVYCVVSVIGHSAVDATHYKQDLNYCCFELNWITIQLLF